MRRSFASWARAVASALTLLLVVAWGAPPAAAADRTATPKPSLSASLAAKVNGLKPTPRAFQAPGAPPAATTSDRSFFHTTTGIVATVVMAAGLAYAVKTAFKDNDPVHSPIR